MRMTIARSLADFVDIQAFATSSKFAIRTMGKNCGGLGVHQEIRNPWRDEDERELNELETNQLLSKNRRRLVKEFRERCIIKVLVELSGHEDAFDIDKFLTYWKRRKAFTPNQLDLLFWRFDKYGIDCERSYFTVSIRRPREKMQLLHLPCWKLHRLWPALSASQRDLLRDRRPYLFEYEEFDDDVKSF